MMSVNVSDAVMCFCLSDYVCFLFLSTILRSRAKEILIEMRLLD